MLNCLRSSSYPWHSWELRSGLQNETLLAHYTQFPCWLVSPASWYDIRTAIQLASPPFPLCWRDHALSDSPARCVVAVSRHIRVIVIARTHRKLFNHCWAWFLALSFLVETAPMSVPCEPLVWPYYVLITLTSFFKHPAPIISAAVTNDI